MEKIKCVIKKYLLIALSLFMLPALLLTSCISREDNLVGNSKGIRRLDEDGYLYYLDYDRDYYGLEAVAALREFGYIDSGCSTFFTHNIDGDPITCRNYDYPHRVSKEDRTLTGLNIILHCKPEGKYESIAVADATWIDPSNPEYEVPSGADNPLGYRWMQIHGNYGIHGTNKPSSIGHYVSNGCIRMWEKDVEALFDEVEVGTPVEITYNRVVVEKAADDQIAYYIYPDGYSRQALDVKYVNSWIEPWGVSAFAEDSEIADAISRSDGEPVYIGKAFNIKLEDEVVPATDQNKRHFDSKAVERGGITYLPAVPIAIALKMKLEWRHHTTLATNYGEVTGIEKKGQLYL